MEPTTRRGGRLGCALTLLFTGLIDSGTVFSGFGDSVIVFIAALFVVVSMTVDILYAVLDPRLRTR